MNLFTGQIRNWRDWGDIFQSIPAFTPLVEYILYKERLPAVKIENLTPGTNAVFKAGRYVVKIYAPVESGVDQTADLQTELFAARRAEKKGVPAPKLLAHGFVEDKYSFAYLITEYIEGAEFQSAVKRMAGAEKIAFGQKLRAATDRINTPCEPFNDIDVINGKRRFRRWDNYPERFKAERLAYMRTHDFGEMVFVHGDLCGDNILVTPPGGLYIIDFADAVLAPVSYEHALLAFELFELDPALLRGYFGGFTPEELTDVCFDGLLLHDFGGDVVKRHIGNPDEFQRLDDLRNKLKAKINESI